MQCPLCHNTDKILDYAADKKRCYLQCSVCNLVFVSPEFLPSPTQEKQEYDLHENSIEDEGYVNFLAKVLTPLSQCIASHNKPIKTGLDFGCGPAPVLASLLQKKDIEMSTYDLFYDNRPDVLSRQYDLITCTEAIEHFHHPHIEWALFNRIILPGGILAIMTKRVIDKARFDNWHYKNDPTHVSFFSESTFRFLATRDGYSVSFPANDVALLIKQ